MRRTNDDDDPPYSECVVNRPANVADDATARVCRARVLDLLRQGWTAKSLAAGGGITPETVGNVVAGRPVSWRTCDVVAAVFEALDGSLRRYQERVNRRQGARVQTLNRMAQLQQMERVRTGYRWGVCRWRRCRWSTGCRWSGCG